MDWGKAGNEFFMRLSGGFSVWYSGLERWRTKFLSEAGRFFADTDHTVLVCGLAVLSLALIFWISLRWKADD